MASPSAEAGSPLRILHVLRAPVGGLFRHVADLVAAQLAAGHEVGIVADSDTGGANAAERLAELRPRLALGVSRIAMPRAIGLRDLSAIRHVAERARTLEADVVHGHGAKGGAYARAVGAKVARVYTPHGGSLNYDAASPSGRVFHGLERLLLGRTDAIVFESLHARRVFETVIGEPPGASRVVVNGLLDDDFAPIALREDAADFVFIGELRMLKGVDVLLGATAALVRDGLVPRVLLVGDGPDEASLKALSTELNVDGLVRFAGRLPAREAFAQGGCVLVPSRKESMPYVVLEAIAAARPIIATHVGGIPEIVAAEDLIPPDDVSALAAAMRAHLAAPDARLQEARTLRDGVRERFSAARMASEIEGVYRRCVNERRARRAAGSTT